MLYILPTSEHFKMPTLHFCGDGGQFDFGPILLLPEHCETRFFRVFVAVGGALFGKESAGGSTLDVAKVGFPGQERSLTAQIRDPNFMG